MAAKIVDMKLERQKKRQKAGWSMSEIERRVEQRRAENKRLDRAEPDVLVSGGDMKRLVEQADDDQE